MKSILVVSLVVLCIFSQRADALTSGEISTLRSLQETFPSLSNVLSTDELNFKEVYQGRSWTGPLEEVCSGTDGFDIHGIYCSGGRIEKILFSESWGKNISSIPDLSALSSVKSLVSNNLNYFTIPNGQALGDLALALASAVPLAELEINTIGTAAWWPSAIYPMIADSVKNISLMFPAGIPMPDWTIFSSLERAVLTARGPSSQPLASLSVFPDSLRDLRLGVLVPLLDASDSSSLTNLEHFEIQAAATSKFESFSFAPSLTYLQINSWPSSGSTALNITSPGLTTLRVLNNNIKLKTILNLPSTLLSLHMDDIGQLTWLTNMPISLESLSYKGRLHFTYPPMSLSECSNLSFLAISSATSINQPHTSLLPSLSNTSVGTIILNSVTNLPNAFLDHFVCSAPRSTLRSLSVDQSGTWSRLPSCMGEFTSLQSLSIYGPELHIYDADLLANVSSSLTSLATNFFPSYQLVQQFPYMEHFQLRSTGAVGSNFFPEALIQWTSLRTLLMKSRTLMGSIPPNLFESMPNLEEVDLSNNQLTDAVPSSGWGSLRRLILSDNLLGSWEGIEAPGAPNLEILDLSYNRLLIMPNESILEPALPNLRELYINDNIHMEGLVPVFWAGQTSKVAIFDASSTKLSGSLPPITSRLLRILDLSFMKLCGPLPEIPFALDLLSFPLKSNHFSGTIPTSWSNLMVARLLIDNNKLEGTIPENIANAHTSRLNQLLIGDNYFTGLMPSLDGHPILRTMYAGGVNMTIDWCGTGPQGYNNSDVAHCSLPTEACPCPTYYPICLIYPACPVGAPVVVRAPITPPDFECPTRPSPSNPNPNPNPNPTVENPVVEAPVGDASTTRPFLTLVGVILFFFAL